MSSEITATREQIKEIWEAGRKYGRDEVYGHSLKYPNEITELNFDEWYRLNINIKIDNLYMKDYRDWVGEEDFEEEKCYCDEDQGAGYTYQDEHGDCDYCEEYRKKKIELLKKEYNTDE